MKQSSYLVVGGGMVGAACALRLCAAGFDTTLVDPGDPKRAASYGNAGCIAAEQCEPLASPHTIAQVANLSFAFGGPLDFRWRDAALWTPFGLRFLRACAPQRFAQGVRALSSLLRDALDAWKRLSALAESSPLLRACGHRVLWMDARRAERGVAGWGRTAIGQTSFRELTSEELAHYGAVMERPPARGIHFTGTGQLADPQAMRDAVLADFTRRGGSICNASVTKLTMRANGAVVHLATGEDLHAHAILIAAGAWSDKLLREVGVRVPLIGERGYSIQSNEHVWPEDLPPAVFEERSLVVARFTSGLRATSFVEFGAPDARGDPRKWRKLERDVRDLGVAFSRTPSRWVGPRPTLPDYLPAIGRLGSHPNVLYAFAHQHLGITLAAVTAEMIEGLATGLPCQIDLTPFSVERFSKRQ